MHKQTNTSPIEETTPQAPQGAKGWWYKFEFKILLNLGTAMLLLATAIMLFEGLSRSFLNTSYFWAEESVRYLLIWAFFLVFGVAGSTGHHIRTDLLLGLLPTGLQRVCNGLASFFGVFFSGIMLYASFPQVARYYKMGMMTESNLDLPMWLVFLAMPLGAALLLSYYLRCLYMVFIAKDPFASDLDVTSQGL